MVSLARMCRETGPKGTVLTFRGNAFSSPNGLVRWLNSKGRVVRLRLDKKLAIMLDLAKRLTFAREMVGALNQVQEQAKSA